MYRTGDVEVHALRGVDVKFFAGEVAVLLGASGSGKSTLLNNLGGLDRGSSGQIVFRGKDSTDAEDDALTEFRRTSVPTP